MKKRVNKKGMVIQHLVGWIIGIAVLAILIILAIVLKDKLAELGSYIKGALRFR